jgi:aryl carrier-like protein
VGYDPAAVWTSDTDVAAPPMSPLEAALAELWASVLEQPAVPLSADFFLLGGDSLRGTRLLGRVRAVLGVDLQLRALFADARTVAGMARHIEAQREKAGPG